MISAFGNPNQPPIMSPEAQDPAMWNVMKANVGQGMNTFSQSMNDPKNKLVMAMMMQQLGKAGQGFAAPKLMTRQAHDTTNYGNLFA